MELIAERGVAAVTYDAIARAAGTSRATLYRKWPQRDDLLREALTHFAETAAAVADTGDIRADIVELLCMLGDTLATPVGRAIINASIMAGEDDPLRQLGRDVLQARLAALQVRVDRAVACGDLPPLDVPFFNTMLVAPVYSLVMRDRLPFTRDLAERIVGAVFDGMAPRRR